MPAKKSGRQPIDQAVAGPWPHALDKTDMAAVGLDRQMHSWANLIGTGDIVRVHEGIIQAVQEKRRHGNPSQK
jgi:hypothetical protein